MAESRDTAVAYDVSKRGDLTRGVTAQIFA
jgi:hypothetical protein